jgi:hypothetical protein
MVSLLNCPICNRRLVGSLCPIHGRVYGSGRTGGNPQQNLTLSGVRTANTAVTAVSSAVTALSAKFPLGEIRMFVVGTAPAGWTPTGSAAIPVGGGVSAYYYKYTG